MDELGIWLVSLVAKTAAVRWIKARWRARKARKSQQQDDDHADDDPDQQRQQ